MKLAKKKLSYWGTMPLFVALLVIIGALGFGMYFIGLKLAMLVFSGFWSYLLGIPITGIIWVLFWNIRLPRSLKNPCRDLNKSNFLSSGAWTNVYRDAKNEKMVLKQLHFCGWGHNDYSDHMAPIIGKKLCGKWNPLALWFLHYYMMMYQIIGLKRRQKIAGSVQAIPNTFDLSVSKLRYRQAYIPNALTPKTCPRDIELQMQLLQEELETCGLYIDDVHAANVRVDDHGKIHLIDGELYTDGEERIKSWLVNLFNGPTVKGMEAVLGNNRVVRWIDHRQSVDDVVNLAKKRWVLEDYRAVRA